MPLTLLGAGTYLAIGCIPVPTTQQFQPDGKLRPEYAVGNGHDKPVRPGYTRIDDAFVQLSGRVGSRVNFGFWGSTIVVRNAPSHSLEHWWISPDARHFAIGYQVRRVIWVMPLCFSAVQDGADRWLILDVDPNGIVRDTHTTKESPPGGWIMTPDRWLTVFDDPMRAKLHAAGVFPSDEGIRQMIRIDDRIRADAEARRAKAAAATRPTVRQ